MQEVRSNQEVKDVRQGWVSVGHGYAAAETETKAECLSLDAASQ